MSSPVSISGGGSLLCCFGVGINNFASGRERRTADLVAAVERKGLRVVAAYGATGNLAVATGALVESVQSLLYEASNTDWAVVDAAEVDRALEDLPSVRHQGSVRWTPGLAFCVGGEAEGIVLVRDTPRARLQRLTPTIVAVQKRDPLRGDRLDPHRRLGGWGRVSADLAAQLRGTTWTARSARTVAGLLGRVS